MPRSPAQFFALVMLLALLLAGSVAPAAGRGVDTPETAFAAALAAYNDAHQSDFSFVLFGQSDGLAYASALPGAPEAGGDPLVLLAYENGWQGWIVLAPGNSAPDEYNRLLESFPDALIDPETRLMLRLPVGHLPDDRITPEGPLAGPAAAVLSNYSGHRLPWPFGQAGYVTQKDTSYHMNQIDFDIRGLAASGDVYSSKPGTVVFVKDSSNTTCQTPSPDPCWKKSNMVVVQHDTGEYTWYLHLAYHSAVVSVGQRVGFGTKLGVEGQTGYSFGVHLHFMASSSGGNWTDPNNPDAAPWPLSGPTAPVDFDEYPWSGLITTYTSTYTSQNGSNLAPVCPGAGALLYRESSYTCAGLLENFGYTLRSAVGFQNISASFNDNASSARVPAGGSVMLYENADRGGGKKCLNAADNNFSNDTFDNGVPLNDQVSSMELFSAPDCPVRAGADLTAPTGSVSSPAAGAQVGRTALLKANAADAQSAVQMVRFSAAWGSQAQVVFTDTSAPYSFAWDLCAAGIADGPIAVTATVIDSAWNTTTSPAVTFNKQYNCSSTPAGSWSARYWNNPNISGDPTSQGEVSGPFLFLDWGAGAVNEQMPADGWSARFTRTFDFSEGTYHFFCQSADSCRLSIDGVERISGWPQIEFSPSEWSGQISAGSHEIRVDFSDNETASARLEAWWEGPGFLSTPQSCTAGAWCASYWGNPQLAGAPVITRNEGEVLRHDWVLTGPDALLPAGHFSTRAERTADFECGTYQFQLNTTSPARLWVDESLVIDQWNETAPPAIYTGELNLERGDHALRIEHAAAGETAELEAGWQKISSCAVSAVVQSASTHVVRPGAAIEPAVSINVSSGELDPARGDGLVYVSGSLMGAAKNQPARSLVENGQGYRFDPSNGFRMTAPSANGSYTSQWAVVSSGKPVSPNAVIHVTVDGTAPQVNITTPGSSANTGSVPIQVNISDAYSGVTHAQFLAGYDNGSGWAWHSLGYDLSSSGGWSFTWNATGVPDQKGVALMVAAWDGAGNEGEARIENITLDRMPPTAALGSLPDAHDSTRFKVTWNGSDALSGLHHYDVQVMVDGGAAQDWLMNVPASTKSAWFVGELGRSYVFQVRAVDNAGNASAYKSSSTPTRINPCTPDSSEPNDSWTKATPLLVEGAWQASNFCLARDVDWFAFTVTAGTRYLIFTNPPGNATDIHLTLYAADGTTMLARNEKTNNGQSGATLTWTPVESGPLYYSIRAADPLVAGNAETYATRVVEARSSFLPQIVK